MTDYDFEFALGQEVHSLRRKLYRFKTVLAGHFRALRAIREHADAIRDLGGVSPQVHTTFKSDAGVLANSLESHRSTVEELLHASNDVKSTVRNKMSHVNIHHGRTHAKAYPPYRLNPSSNFAIRRFFTSRMLIFNESRNKKPKKRKPCLSLRHGCTLILVRPGSQQ